MEKPNGAIGHFIRQQIIPTGMSVTEAARRLGVSRPALSKLLNGRVALSTAMALRLERTFGADRRQLLDLQTTSERDRLAVTDRAVTVGGAYIPDFLTIKAKQIAEWAATIDARNHLPVLLRRLIYSTGRELQHVDFPGFDNAQRHGWDGWVEAGAATPWVPAGRSGWEFGVGERPRRKAESDYQARLRMLAPAQRADCTFVFVTPRNWPGKSAWTESKTAAGDWKAVRVFDACNLEQWLETAVSPRIWLAGEIGLPTNGFQTIEEYWDQWVAASDPPMTQAIFAPSIGRNRDAFRKWLGAPPDRPFTVAADSREEAVAFIACLLRQDNLPAGSCDRAVFFDSAETLKLLIARPSAAFIPIVCKEETERAIGNTFRQRHCIVVRPRNAVGRKPDSAVDLLEPKEFADALEDMGIERGRVGHLALESGYSPTVLRRRLSNLDAIRNPAWARETNEVRHLIPMTLIGTWNTESEADRKILERIAGTPYREVERNMAELLLRDDCPVWQVDHYCGVVSKIDALFALAPSITRTHLTDFLKLAESVLSESDPGLEFPLEERWMAGFYGKEREHSAALRTGVCETLVLLAVHGNSLFQILGIDVEDLVSDLVRRLLTPFTNRNLLSHDGDLPNYAEAAPEAFLTLLEKDLKRPDPVLRTLLRKVDPGIAFDSPSRTGLLWALERLAWSPRLLMRVVLVLADLSRTKIDDNWVNKPIRSLKAIFRSWIPQTAAALNERIKALEVLCKRFPDIGWKICIQQLIRGHDFAFPSARPRWRSDATGAGEPLTVAEAGAFLRKALDLAIQWRHNQSTLGDLVDRLVRFPEKDQLSIWKLIGTWSQTEENEWKKAELRERIRRSVPMNLQKGMTVGWARMSYEKLEPRDPVVRHAWLFKGNHESADELQDESHDWEERAKRVYALRAEAMKEIWSVRGLDGAVALLPELPERETWNIGHYAASCASNIRSAIDVLRQCLTTDRAPCEKVDGLMSGFIGSLKDTVRTAVLSSSAEFGGGDRIVRLFRCSPFGEQTWRLLSKHVREVRDLYWSSVTPGFVQPTEPETNELIDRLLEVDRPRAAFSIVRFDWEKVETSRLKRLLVAVATVDSEPVNNYPTVDSEPADHYKIDSYRLSEALGSLSKRPGVTTDEMAQLEFMFIGALHDSEYGGIPHLEQCIAESPLLFVQMLALVYRRSDHGQDPPAWRVDDPARRDALGAAAAALLERVERMPGTNSNGQVGSEVVKRWVIEARDLCKKHSRVRIGDQIIGGWLSRAAPYEDDGPWPGRPVCEILEMIASEDMAAGFRVGAFNRRGVTKRGAYEGGGQERDLAATYRSRAQEWGFEYPFVGKILYAISKHYEKDATRQDARVSVRKRLEH